MTQLSDLQDTLAAIGADVDAIITDVAKLQDALATANASTAVDLTDANNAANAIREKLDAIKTGLEPAAPASEPSA